MSNHIIGGDLGTTNSCVHLVTEGGVELVRFVEDGGGESGEPRAASMPSVVYLDAGGDTHIGRPALRGVGETPGPVFAVKRNMGTDRPVRLGDRERSAVDVSAMILGELKAAAERQGGDRVTHSVVTVPAYFSHRQKSDTEEAARKAGFQEIVIQQEPVAAALAYVSTLPPMERTILVYDLGGGTFDVSIVRQTRNGGLVVVAFGGDQWLGGGDFDSRLADLLRSRLASEGVKLTWDLEKVDLHRSYFTQLKMIAEETKIGLSDRDVFIIDRAGLFPDDDGTMVDLNTTVTREEFETLIRADVEKTIKSVHGTLDAAAMRPEHLDAVVMVGGSSRIPLVARMLEEALGVEPQLVDPDTVVSRGAALKAESVFPLRAAGEGVFVDVEYPRLTDGASCSVRGALHGGAGEGIALLVRGDYEEEVEIASDGSFRFDDVPLDVDDENEFGLSVLDDDDEEIVSSSFVVVQSGEQENDEIPAAVIARRMSVETANGPLTLVESGTTMPCSAPVTLYTNDTNGTIRVPVLESAVKIGELRIDDVPDDTPLNTPVYVELHFGTDYKIEATAAVEGSEMKAACVLEIPALNVPTLADAEARMLEARNSFREYAEKGYGSVVEENVTSLIGRLQRELVGSEPRMGLAAELLCELEFLLAGVKSDIDLDELMTPSLDEFKKKYEQVTNRARRKRDAEPQFDHEDFMERVTRLDSLSEHYWKVRDFRNWKAIWGRIDELDEESKYDCTIDELEADEARAHAIRHCDSLEEIDTAMAIDGVPAIINGARAKIETDPHQALKEVWHLVTVLVEADVITLSDSAPKRTMTGLDRNDDLATKIEGLLKNQG